MTDSPVAPDSSADPGTLALAFVNTVRIEDGRATDTVPSPRALAAWLHDEGVLAAAAVRQLSASPPEARILLDEAHRLRTELHRAVVAFAAGAPLSPTLLPALNRSLRLRRNSLEAVDGARGIVVEERREPAPVAALLAPLAKDAVALLREDPGRVRQCHATTCSLWFLDTSKNGSRKWCSMARCGNRAKAAAHYRRAQDEA